MSMARAFRSRSGLSSRRRRNSSGRSCPVSRACCAGRILGSVAQVSTQRLSRRIVLLLAVATGASVANLYYAQPLLHAIAQSLGTSASTAALLVTASQIGYAAGLA